MKKFLVTTAIAGSLLTSATLAKDSVTAEVGVTTNYLSNGFTQTNDKPALQAGVTYAHNSGAYIGVWGSNV